MVAVAPLPDAGDCRDCAGNLERRVWALLDELPDPEIPVISLTDLGVIRHVRTMPQGVQIGVTPTYTGCPATAMIRSSVIDTLQAAGIAPVQVVDVLEPAWSTDWITERGATKLRRFGIAPPRRRSAPILPPACPQCQSTSTEQVSEFGSTPCKSLYRCCECLEPFEHFKCI